MLKSWTEGTTIYKQLYMYYNYCENVNNKSEKSSSLWKIDILVTWSHAF